MRINLIKNMQYFNEKSISFSGKRKSEEEIEQEYSKIFDAINEIAQNDEIKPNLATLAQMTGLPYTTIAARINSYKGNEIRELWEKILNERGYVKFHNRFVRSYDSVVSEPIRNSTTASQREEEIELLTETILKMMQQSDVEPTVNNLAQISGLSYYTVVSRLQGKTTKSAQLFQLWSDAKRSYQDRIKQIKVKEKHKPSPVYDKKRKMKKALGIIQQAINTKTRVSYKQLEDSTGLNKEEIDNLIKQYTQYKADNALREKQLKEEQAKWYEDKLNNEGD